MNSFTAPSCFLGPDFICYECAERGRRASGHQNPIDLDEWRPVGACAACGDLSNLLPARQFGVAAPSFKAHCFAAAVVEAWCGSGCAEHMRTIARARARSQSGRYWVEFKPAGAAYIHTEAARTPTEAIARFLQAVSC